MNQTTSVPEIPKFTLGRAAKEANFGIGTLAGICRRIIGDARQRIGIARKSGRDPGLLGCLEGRAEGRPLGNAARH